MKSAGGVFGEFILQGIKKEGMERVCLGGVDGAFSSREEARRRHTGGDHARDHHFVVSCEKRDIGGYSRAGSARAEATAMEQARSHTKWTGNNNTG
mmetsp:Transcript_16792/g.67758  ORF Transcript_16792/g.67758 Transcript_16792/m.67758 type:complete len:96 (-) Transcript_16792:774-1061(-)